jgi:hypothetical protein
MLVGDCPQSLHGNVEFGTPDKEHRTRDDTSLCVKEEKHAVSSRLVSTHLDLLDHLFCLRRSGVGVRLGRRLDFLEVWLGRGVHLVEVLRRVSVDALL